MTQETLIQAELSAIHGDCRFIEAGETGLDPRAGALFVGEDYVASTRPGPLEYFGRLADHAQREEHDSYVVYFADAGSMDCPVMHILATVRLQPELLAA